MELNTENLKKFDCSVFIAVWHGPKFLESSIPAIAPAEDLSYFYDMLELSESEDRYLSRIGSKVCESIQRHTCYLKPPQVIFSLFNQNSSALELQEIASKLSTIPRPGSSAASFKPGKLPDVQLLCSVQECVGSSLCVDDDGNLFPRKTLPDLLSSKSYLLFNSLKIEDLSWLNAPATDWHKFSSYQKCFDFVNKIMVVNDGAERGIKLN